MVFDVFFMVIFDVCAGPRERGTGQSTGQEESKTSNISGVDFERLD